jgi:hypothetical protein
MVLNSIRRILVAVVLCVGISGLGAGMAYADDFATGEPGETFTPPYEAS